jgi:hypothetical protein
VRERTRRSETERPLKPLDLRTAERAYFLWENAGRPKERSKEFWEAAVKQEHLYGEPPAIDMSAVLTVINRCIEAHRALEPSPERVLDFRRAVLRRAYLRKAHLKDADFQEAHLEGADFPEAHLESAILREAHLDGAVLTGRISKAPTSVGSMGSRRRRLRMPSAT